MGRAMAHATKAVPRFDDPIAIALLPEDARARVARALSNEPPKALRARMERGYLRRQAVTMGVRTVAIDDAVREVTSPQLVVLGAGLDARAWRMLELRDVVVFEVDHPDSQRDKRARVPGESGASRDIRFVAVDFERDSLDAALDAAGHDPSQPTTWIWEGVVMYLRPADVEATLEVISRRSANKSRIVIAYHAPALILHLFGPFLRHLGEPLRSSFTAREMRDLLGRHGFTVAWDDGIPALGAALSPSVKKAVQVVHHLRIVAADRA